MLFIAEPLRVIATEAFHADQYPHSIYVPGLSERMLRSMLNGSPLNVAFGACSMVRNMAKLAVSLRVM